VDGTPGLSPYLHFGQISPAEVAWRAAQVGGPGAQAFLLGRAHRPPGACRKLRLLQPKLRPL
jgi:hypothetical protein